MIAIGLLLVRMLCDWFKPRSRLENRNPDTAASAQRSAAFPNRREQIGLGRIVAPLAA
jgi:hypothetical protein